MIDHEAHANYVIEDSDNEASQRMRNGNRRSSRPRSFRRPASLTELLKPLTTQLPTRGTKREAPKSSNLINKTPKRTVVNPAIDESSPVKKVHQAQFADSSAILVNRKERKGTRVTRRSSRSSLPGDDLVSQMKALVEKEKTRRSIWLHSTTSQLKNKIKEPIERKDSLTVQLSSNVTKFGSTFAVGKCIATTRLNKDTVGEKIKLIFPSYVSESMGFSNGDVIKLISPWNSFLISGQKYIINPFWINVTKRGAIKPGSDAAEETIVTWTCPCRQSNGAIDSLTCSSVDL